MVTMLPEPNPTTNCPADHRSIDARLLIGEGLEWRRCPFCSTMVEGALRKGIVVGPEWGKGRGPLTPRQQARLRAILGWTDHLGGR